jgi:hypothetical protein
MIDVQEMIDGYNYKFKTHHKTMCDIKAECGTYEKAAAILGTSHTWVLYKCREEREPPKKRITLRKVLQNLDCTGLTFPEIADITGWNYTWVVRVCRDMNLPVKPLSGA